MLLLRVMRQWCIVILMPHTNPPLIGTTEAARLLGKSPRTVHRLVASGDLVPEVTAPGGKAGAFLFKRSDIERLARMEKAAS